MNKIFVIIAKRRPNIPVKACSSFNHLAKSWKVLKKFTFQPSFDKMAKPILSHNKKLFIVTNTISKASQSGA